MFNWRTSSHDWEEKFKEYKEQISVTYWNHTFIFIAKPYFLSEWTYTFGYFLHHYHNNYYTQICVVSVHISFSYKTVQNTMLRNLKDNNSFGYQPVTI